ncbi:MAG: permease [Polyangiaceae bacterium]|nr:permease [Polyangiaceae bacterium]
MVWVLCSLLALGVGPALIALARRQRWVLGVVDGFVVVTIGGIVLLHILPHAYLVGGWALLGVAALGLLGPAVLERVVGPRLPVATRWMLPLALLGLSLHAFIDGAVLVEAAEGHSHGHGHDHGPQEHGAGGWVAIGVILHRIPEGIASWWVFRQRHGVRGAALALLGIGGATALGFALGERLEGHLTVLHGLQALVAGSLLHVIFHRSHDLSTQEGEMQILEHSCELDFKPAPAREEHHGHDHLDALVEPGPLPGFFQQAPAAVGALLGGLMLWGVSLAHPASHRISSEIGMGVTFLTLALESAPALLLSYGVVALTHAFWPSGVTRWLGQGGGVKQALKALALGPLVPVCSCGVIPLYRGFVTRASSSVAAVTLLVAAPELGLATFFLSLSLLGAQLTAVRMVGAVALSLVLGLVVGRLARRPEPSPEGDASGAEPRPAVERLRGGVSYAATDAIDYTLPWVVMGLGVAAFLEPSLGQQALARRSGVQDVLLGAALGIPLYVCATGVTPLAAILLHKGLSSGAALALLLAGPAANLTTLRMLAQLHGRRVAWAFAALLALLVIGLGLGVNAVLGSTDPMALHDAAHGGPEPFQVACLALLGALGLASLARRGPRFWVEQVVAAEHQHAAPDGAS